MGKVILEFSAGTLLLHEENGEGGLPEAFRELAVRDERTGGQWRAAACQYAPLLRLAHQHGIEIDDRARNYETLELKIHSPFAPLEHQKRAMECWRAAQARGTVVMPTGSGKTYFAVRCIAAVNRSAIVLAPTIDLMVQWAGVLKKFFQTEIGMLGGGSKEILPLTVSTYDSAVLQMEFIGNRFGLIVFDECHHLPGQVNRMAASMCIAPYRLGLTATPEREDDGEEVMARLIGPVVFRAYIDELEGNVLAPYVTRRLRVELSEAETAEYAAARKTYTSFVRRHQIDFSEPDGWGRFIAFSARIPGGREAFTAYLKQRQIARCGRAKLELVWKLLREHRGERILVFTADNDAAYQMGEAFCLPVLTHKTKAAERRDFLERFRKGEYPVLLTSKVLNEGVDVPEASVGIVVSGSGSIREHVQRLGRILRAKDGKQAILYELVSEGTSEMRVSDRRRQNRAYDQRRLHYRQEYGDPYAD